MESRASPVNSHVIFKQTKGKSVSEMAANYRLIAIQVGDALKYSTSINEINRIAGAIFPFPCESFSNESITSSRAKLVHDWILSLAKQKMGESERNALLKSFID